MLKRLIGFLILAWLAVAFVWPAWKNQQGGRSVFPQSNQWVAIQDTIENQLIPNLQQFLHQLPDSLQSFQPDHVLQGLQATGSSAKPTDPKSLLQVKAGDSDITAQKLSDIQSLVTTFSYPTLQKAIAEPYHQPVEIWLYSTAPSYRAALMNSGVDSQQAHLMTRETGGIAQGNRILVPLYQTNTKPELVNILTHEMTHVALNQLGIGDELPTWINEGLAWQEGLTAEQRVDSNRVAMEQMQMKESIRQAYANGYLLPLSSSEQDILNAKYNVEAEDYLAVVYLEKSYGVNSMNQFLNELHKDSLPAWIPASKSQGTVYQTFQSVFHVSFETFENQFTDSLAK